MSSSSSNILQKLLQPSVSLLTRNLKKQMYFNSLKSVKVRKISDFLAEITRWNIMTWAVICFTPVDSKSSGLGELCFSYCKKIFQGFLINHPIFPGTTCTFVAGASGRLESIWAVDREIVVYNFCLISISAWVKDRKTKISVLST